MGVAPKRALLAGLCALVGGVVGFFVFFVIAIAVCNNASDALCVGPDMSMVYVGAAAAAVMSGLAALIVLTRKKSL
jgi:hypothetical protein